MHARSTGPLELGPKLPSSNSFSWSRQVSVSSRLRYLWLVFVPPPPDDPAQKKKLIPPPPPINNNNNTARPAWLKWKSCQGVNGYDEVL